MSYTRVRLILLRFLLRGMTSTSVGRKEEMRQSETVIMRSERRPRPLRATAVSSLFPSVIAQVSSSGNGGGVAGDGQLTRRAWAFRIGNAYPEGSPAR